MSDAIFLIGGDEPVHELDEVVGEQGIDAAIGDPPGPAIDHLDRAEARLCKFLDEVTLRQGSGYSAGPGGRMRQDLRRQSTLFYRQIGDAEFPAGFEHPRAFRDHSRLAR